MTRDWLRDGWGGFEMTGNCSETTGNCFKDDEGHWEMTENSTGDGNGPGENCLQQD
jgi:hypothetical protein